MTTVSCKRKVRVWVEVIVNRGAALYGESSLFTQNRGQCLFCPLLREMHFYLPSSTFFLLFI